jgi:hypothetical protein
MVVLRWQAASCRLPYGGTANLYCAQEPEVFVTPYLRALPAL